MERKDKVKSGLTYYKAAVWANHVPCSVVLHQYGIRVVGTLDPGQGQCLSAGTR